MAFESHRIKRSFNHTSILLVGSSGVGKSSTINHLFSLENEKRVEFAKTSARQSETRDTQEYEIVMDDPAYKVQGLTLGVVDSPGFNDTEGIKQDACNMYSIKRFFETHPKLQGCKPNLIFILVTANDTRIAGDNSSLAKSLLCLKEMQLVDQKNPNVVAVLSFACHLGRSAKKFTKNFNEKKRLIQDAIFKFLHVSAEVVPIENDLGDEEDEEDRMERSGDWTVLPDKSVQPLNLFEVCQKLLLNNEDDLGQYTFSSAFSSSREKKIRTGVCVKAKNSKLESLNPHEEKFWKFFERTAQGGLDEPLIHEASTFIKEKNLSNQVICIHCGKNIVQQNISESC